MGRHRCKHFIGKPGKIPQGRLGVDGKKYILRWILRKQNKRTNLSRVSFCEHGVETSSAKRGGEFVQQLRKSWLLMDSAQCMYLVVFIASRRFKVTVLGSYCEI
jgi:hypothetical protein